jgi:PAS domain S-box-containing protein
LEVDFQNNFMMNNENSKNNLSDKASNSFLPKNESFSENDEKYKALLETSPNAISIATFDGKFVDCNNEFSTLLGYSEHEIIGSYAKELNIWKNADREKLLMNELSANGFVKNFEVFFIRKNAEEVFANLFARIIQIDDISYVLCFVEDKTKQIEFEKGLKKSEQHLRELNMTKDKFFSIIAHDLKSPFNAILGFAELLYQDFDLYNNDDKRNFAKNIMYASKNTYKLIENLLQWSRTQTGKIKYRPDYYDFSIIANDTISVLREQAIKKNITLRSDISFNTIAYFDSNMIITLLRNLVSNAIKFSFRDSEVFIRSEYIKKEVDSQKKSYLQISVSDKGVGIRKENFDKLFYIDKHFKTEGTENEKGTGLGLILCKEFVEINDGTIWLESEIGKGSTFYFCLPMID